MTNTDDIVCSVTNRNGDTYTISGDSRVGYIVDGPDGKIVHCDPILTMDAAMAETVPFILDALDDPDRY